MKITNRLTRALPALALFLLATISGLSQTGLVISQVYSAGGNSGALYKSDFVEIYNPTSSPVTMTNWTIQYASATASGTTTWTPEGTLNGTLQPGQYFLVAATPGTNGSNLPVTPDVTSSTLALGAAAGRVLLSNSNVALIGCPTGSAVVDLVGYGTTATCYEGHGPAPAPSTTLADIRTNPSADTNDNANDFTTGTPNPHSCGCASSGTPITVTSLATPAIVNNGDSTLLTVTVTPGASPASTGITVSADLTVIGGSANQQFYDDGTHGDATAGDNVFSLSTTANTTANGTIQLTANIIDAQSRTASTKIILLANPNVLSIHDIQGPKSTTAATVSPQVGKLVQTSGIVTSVINNGFFIQTPDGQIDGNPLTPEGVEVFTSSAPTVAVGDSVTVTGTVQQFPSPTVSPTPAVELASPTTVVNGHNYPLPTPITLDASMLTASGGLYQLTPYESMRVYIASLTAISGTDGNLTETSETTTSNGRFYAVIGNTARPFREPGIDIRDTLPAGAPANIARFDDNPERIYVDSAIAGGAPIDLSSGARLAAVTGVLDFTFSSTYSASSGSYFYDPSRLILDPGYNSAYFTPGMTVQPAPAASSNQFTVAAYNVERFFNTSSADNISFNPVTGTAGASSAVNVTQAAYNRRLQKVSLAIRNVLNSPDIVALEEIENQSVASDIAAQISADALAAGQPDPKYVPYGTGTSYAPYTNDISGISTGFLVKSTTVNTIDIKQYGANDLFSDPRDATGNTKQTLNDRPPLVLHAGIKRANAKDYPVTVIVNHLRSLSGENDPSSGIFVRAKKELQAEYLANLIQGFQANHEHVISLGDYNVFEFSDGYLDVMSTATGNTPLPADQVVQPGVGGLITPAATDIVTLLPADQRWSYVEFGNAQVLDHMVVTSDLISSTNIAYAHIDADFPLTAYNDATTPARSSDHDPVVGYFTIPTPSIAISLSPSTGSFGSVTLGNSSAGQVFTFNNTGETNITISKVVTGGDYAVNSNCQNALNAGSSCTSNVVFTPTAAGTRGGTLNIVTNLPIPTFTALLSGTGVAPALPTLAPASLTFSNTLVGASSAAQTITVTNNAAAPITIGSVAVSGDYSQTNTCGTIVANGSCSVLVTFKPTATGSRTGALTVSATGYAATTLTGALTGTGVIPDFTLADSSGNTTTSVTAAAGNSGTVSLTFTPVNGFTGTVAVTCASTAAPTGATCTAPSSFTIGPAASTQTISFTTTSRTLSSGLALSGNGLTWTTLTLLSLSGLLMLLATRARRMGRSGVVRLSRIGGLFTLLLAFCLPAIGCGGSSGPKANPNGTPAGTYAYTVTATSGTLTHTETVNLTVQ